MFLNVLFHWVNVWFNKYFMGIINNFMNKCLSELDRDPKNSARAVLIYLLVSMVTLAMFSLDCFFPNGGQTQSVKIHRDACWTNWLHWLWVIIIAMQCSVCMLNFSAYVSRLSWIQSKTMILSKFKHLENTIHDWKKHH